MSYSHYHPAYPYGYPPHGYPSHPGYATPPQHGFYPGHPPHHYTAPPASTGNDLAAEEAAALAHLQAIQARRRAQEQETATTRPPFNFGDFIARAMAEERKREREEAVQAKARAEARAAKEHSEREARRAKEHAEREARKAKEEAERVARKAREVAARHAEQAREEAARARAIAIAEARQAKWNAMMAARQRYAQQQVDARRQWIQRHAAQAQQVREALAENEYAQRAARCAREAAKPHVEKYANHIGQLNEVLGSLFGINLVQDEQPEEKEKAQEKPVEEKEKHVEFKEPVDEEPATAPAAEKEATATETKEASAAKEQPGFPDSINDILGSFLGLRVEPTTKDTAAPSAPADLSGLNELLGRFGLVFEPEAPTTSAPEAGPSTARTATAPAEPTPEASSSAPKAAPAPAHEETPLTSFLNGVTDLPPFVRDILGNLEQAWKEEATASQGTESGKKDKGKGVAPGEKPSRPTPAPETPSPAESDSSTTSLSQLSTIADELALVRDSFTFPDRLAFAPSTEGSAPALLFNKTNSTYHAQANKLLQLLLAADGVSSGGDREVRSKRKELVRAVESEIQALEKKRDAVWDEVKARREASGEISEDEDGLSTGSAAPSVIDHEEVPDVVFHYDEPEAEHVEHVDGEKVDGFDVPTPAPEVAAAESTPAPAAETPVENKEVEVEEEETDNVDRKDDGKPVDKKVLDAEEYELL